MLLRLAIFLSVVCRLAGPTYGDAIGRGGYADSPSSSVALAPRAEPALRAEPAPRAEPATYAPITLRGPSTSLSSVTGSDSPQSQRLDGATTSGLPLDPDRPLGDLPEGSPSRRSMTTPLVTIASSLALVLGLFAALVWVSRKAQRGHGIARPIPNEVLCVLGQKHLGALGTISIVRCGRTVMIVSQSATGIQSLATITDEAEVRHLEAACLGESAASFQATLSEIEREQAGRGFLGEGIAQPNARKKLFTQA